MRQNFINYGIGTDAQTVFETLRQEAITEHGRSCCNGTISTCCLGNCELKFDKLNSISEKKTLEFIKERENGRELHADYVDMGVVEYHVTTYKKAFSKCNVVYRTKFVVKNAAGENVKVFDTQKEASEYMLAERLEVVVKEPVAISGDKECCRLQRTVKVYKTEPKRVPKGATLEAIHKFAFYGGAACQDCHN